MNIKPFNFSYPDYSGIFDLEDFFGQIKNNYPELKKQGIFWEGKKKSIFIYRIKTKSRDYHGLIAAVSINDYLNGLIKKHENTLVAQEENISKLMNERDGIIKPVLLAYPQKKSIKDLIIRSFLGKKPKFTVHFPKEQQIHELYKISNEKAIKDFQNEFSTQVPSAYIADGHHRIASITKMLQENPEYKESKLNSMMCALFDFNELTICAYHRFIEMGDDFNFETYSSKIKKIAEFKKLKTLRFPKQKGELVFHYGNSNYALKWKNTIAHPTKNKTKVIFDIDIFNTQVLTGIFGINDIRIDTRIQNLDGAKSLKQIIKLTEEKPNALFVLFYPVKSRDFIKVADKHQVLPPKSTWFEPRIRNGLIVQDFKHKEK
jgi:uncharacterized protein (DUF1015 family)